MDNILKIKNLLQYTKTSDKTYNGRDYEWGYHSLIIHGTNIKGQRDPKQRLKDVPFDFSNKTMLDIGSNQGGMIFAIQDKIKEGIGIDFDHRLINAANKIKGSHNYHNLNFFVFDLENEDFNLINNFASNKFDIIFLLSVCMWIESWKELCIWCAANAKSCLFETNGKESQQQEQLNFLQTLYKKVVLVRDKSTDDKNQLKRSLYYCEN
jgi:2-polyprenyl-3-methyl-5-hydroxy-6-metoxy-1,4-benzoquinol methylase